MKKTFILLLGVLLSINTYADELSTIRRQYIQSILSTDPDEQRLTKTLTAIPQEKEMSDQMVVELHQRYTPEKKRIELLLSSIQQDGSWKDIDYADKKRSGWLPKNHADRILELAKVYATPPSEFYHSKEVAQVLHKAMKYWFDKKLVCPNWWYNQIGIPKTLGPAFILFEDQLSDNEKQEAIRVMKQSKFGMTGQNKVWLAGNVFIRALLQKDMNLLKASRDTIASEITTGQTEGIQDDWSFHQHGPQQQFGNYGAAFISGMATWSNIFSGTSLAFTTEQINILYSLLTQGYRRILWKGNMDINALGRQFFHNAQHHKAFTIAFAALALSKADPAHEKEYKAILEENFYPSHSYAPLNGIYHFRNSDLTIQRTPGWMASVRMSSKRVIGAEAGNGDNLKGYYLADGATYIYVDGDEYNNIFPCWDWRKIPGITSYDTSDPLPELSWGGYRNNSTFVGNVNDGQEGMTAMIFERDKLKARKSWIFTPEYVICLGGAIATDSSCMVGTSIEQRLKKGDLLQLNNKKWEAISGVKEINPASDRRFFHDKTGYIILSPSKGIVFSGSRTGRWCDIMQMYEPEEVKKEVVSLYISHGMKPQDGEYSYILLPASTPQKVKDFSLKSIRILRNGKDVQAVSIDNNTTFFIAVYSNADLQLAGKFRFTAHTPGIYMIKKDGKKWKVSVCDPTQKLDSLSFKINDTLQTVSLPKGKNKGGSVSMV